MKIPDVIGIAGTFASGKDTIAEQLVKDFGYTHVSTSNLVRELAMKERGSIERPVLFEVADAHRHKDGPGFLVKIGLTKQRPVVITGIRSLGEAKEIKAVGGTLIFVDAPIKVRYERMKSRLRDGEAERSFEEFAAGEAKEMHSGSTDADFNLRDIRSMADVVVDNEQPIKLFLERAYQMLGLYSTS